MIEQIGIKNFKSLKDVSVSVKPLNLLAGLNSMGKSSFIQTLLLIKQSDRLADYGQLTLKGKLADVGKGEDALYQFASGNTIELSFLLSDKSALKLSLDYKPESEFLESPAIWERYGSAARDVKHMNSIARPVLKCLRGLQYLSADRVGPMVLYDSSQSSVAAKNLGVRGEYTAHFLYVNGNRYKVDKRLKHERTEEAALMNQVNGWLSEISPGVKLSVTEVPGIDKMLLSYQFELGRGRTASFRPGNVGFGVSYVLATVVSLLSAEKDKIIILENPEAHIHPRGQAELGKLMALAAASGAQLFVETHSDHIINGVRVAVKEGIIDKHDVNFSYFSKVTTNEEQYTEITEIKVDERGELSDYPKDFLDEWNNQLLKLI